MTSRTHAGPPLLVVHASSKSWMPMDSRAMRANVASNSAMGAVLGSAVLASIARSCKSETGAR